jgi:ABC-2 type transport system permease protein
MFTHIFFTRLKCLIRKKQLIFWSFIFPIFLATLFKIAFSNIYTNENFKAIDVAVISNAAYEKNQGFKKAIELVSSDEKEKLFNVTYAEEKNAEELLKNGKIEGYIYLDPEIKLIVKSSSIKATVIKTFLDNYKQSESTIAAVIKENPKAAIDDLIKDISSFKEYTKEVSPSRGKPNTILNYFYTIIAMACLYGSFSGLNEVNDIQGNLSKKAARVNIAPVHKVKVFLYSLLAALLIQFIDSLFLLAYLYWGLKVDFGNQIPYIILLCFVGSAAGISLGTMVSSLIKSGEGVKIAVLIGVSNIACFLAGMYYSNMKYIVEKNVPILSYINPATLITDGLYTLYYYNSHERYFINISLLCVLTILFCFITYLNIRREKYASI